MTEVSLTCVYFLKVRKGLFLGLIFCCWTSIPNYYSIIGFKDLSLPYINPHKHTNPLQYKTLPYSETRASSLCPREEDDVRPSHQSVGLVRRFCNSQSLSLSLAVDVHPHHKYQVIHSVNLASRRQD